jgi:hypothetical protein
MPDPEPQQARSAAFSVLRPSDRRRESSLPRQRFRNWRGIALVLVVRAVNSEHPTPPEHHERRRQSLFSRTAWLGLFSAIAAGALGCGRKATVDDCQQIVKRIVELELESVVPEQELSSEVREAQQTFRERALTDCVGRRISNKSLECVAKAKSTATIIDDCLD